MNYDCEFCNQRLYGSEDFINHLQFSHNVTRGFQRYLKRALKIKVENTGESEVFTVDRDDQDLERIPDHEGNQSDLDQNLENQIREKVKQTVAELFQPIKTLLTENVVPEPASAAALHEKIDSSKAEEELLRSFKRMRILVDQMNFPEEMFNPIPTLSDPFRPPPRKADKTSVLSGSPTKSEKSSASSCGVGSLYQCPKCDLKITKKQMKENENAKHLSRHHKVDQKTYDSDRQSFHFIKVPIIQ